MSDTFELHPVEFLSRAEKELALDQRGVVLWFYGRSGSGKSTLIKEVERTLHYWGGVIQCLDGDNIRTKLNKDLGFSNGDREENIRRTACVAELFKDAGIITLVGCITPTREMRQIARDIVGERDFREIYVNADMDVCEARDPKGIYSRARAGKLPGFIEDAGKFEEPEEGSALVLDTATMSVKESVDLILDLIPDA